MHPDVEGVDFRLGFRRSVVILVVVVIVMVVMMGGFLVGLLRVLESGTFIMMVVMVMTVVVLVQMLIFVMFVGLFRVLKTGTLIVVVVTMVVMLVEVAPGKRRQRHPQHHQEQSEGDVNPDVFRVRFLLDGDGASPPHLGVIHPRGFPPTDRE